jgi:hypothetical protein
VDTEQLVSFSNELFGGDEWPKPLGMLRGLLLIEQDRPIAEAAAAVGAAERIFKNALQSGDALRGVLGEDELEAKPVEAERRKNLIGQLVVGRAAEFVFENIYKRELGDSEFTIADQRQSRSETDYRMLDGSSRPVYRLNVKFFGSVFRAAQQYVQLDQNDCFPLATRRFQLVVEQL